jgi:hypothetical protein
MEPEQVQALIQNSGYRDDTLLGYDTSIHGIPENIALSDHYRLLNVLTIGPIGYGKTQLMIHSMLQDSEKGRGFCFINPKGGAIDQLLAKLPDDRLEDVIYINPDQQRVPAINVLEPHVSPAMSDSQRDRQVDILVSDLVSLFKRLSENWGDRFGLNLETLLRAHIRLNIDRDEQNTLMDVFQCVIDEDALIELMDRVHHPVIRKQLENMHALTEKEMEPLERRINGFIQSDTVRRFITQPQNSINIRKALDQDEIILVDVQKGTIGSDVAALIGSIVITQLWAAAQSRITLREADREPYYLYLDEASTFSSEGSNLEDMLSQGREYKLGCWIASQYLNQLDTALRRALKNNCRTKIFFNPSGSEDVPQIVHMLQGIEAHQLTALGKYRAAVQAPSEQQHRPAELFTTYPPWQMDHEQATGRKTMILEQYEVLEEHTGLDRVRPSEGYHQTAGTDGHRELLTTAFNHFTQQNVPVNILRQTGDEKPDGELLDTTPPTNLEVEAGTLSKPAKVLQNYKRASDAGRDVVFVVDTGNATKLTNILDDPVNRRGEGHEDEKGTYSFYEGDSQPFTAVDELDAEYRIYEVWEDELVEYDRDTDTECPELVEGNATEDELTAFCVFRDESGYCSALGQPCVLTEG